MEIGTKFGAIIDQLHQPVTGSPQRFAQPVIAKPTSDAQCNALRRWAESCPPSPPVSATEDDLIYYIEIMASVLPSKNVDMEAGARRVVAYAALLGTYSADALALMATEACRRLRWFPTPRDCLDILAEYRPPVSDQETALRLCQDYTTEQFDRWFANVSAGQPIGDVPEQWQRIAVERGVLRRLPGGPIVIRAKYHGPFKSYQAAEAKAA